MHVQVDEEEFGVVRNVELKENGASIDVTEENKREYVDLVIQHKFINRVSAQMNACVDGRTEGGTEEGTRECVCVSVPPYLCECVPVLHSHDTCVPNVFFLCLGSLRFLEGLTAVIDKKWLQPFSARELEVLISGISEIDVNDWKQNTIYFDGYTSTSQVGHTPTLPMHPRHTHKENHTTPAKHSQDTHKRHIISRGMVPSGFCALFCASLIRIWRR